MDTNVLEPAQRKIVKTYKLVEKKRRMLRHALRKFAGYDLKTKEGRCRQGWEKVDKIDRQYRLAMKISLLREGLWHESQI